MRPNPARDTRVQLTSFQLPGHLVIAIYGELDVASAGALREQLLVALHHAKTPVIFDLAAISLCDAAGLALLVGLRRRAKLQGVAISLAAPRSHVRDVLHIAGLHRAFTIHANVAAARRHRPPIRPVAA